MRISIIGCDSDRNNMLQLARFWFVVLVMIVITGLTAISQFEVQPEYIMEDADMSQNNDNISAFLKTIHQVWLGYDQKEPPEAWRNATKISRETNPDFTYRLWSATDVIALLEKHYSWFLPVYHSYPYDVERADAARYFIIRHHGGIYLDMDEVSVVSISEIIKDKALEQYDCVIPEGTPSGITNYIIMCKKQSPFMTFLTSRLRHTKGWYGIPYATVMWSTGPRFVSGTYQRYTNKDSLYIMPGADVRRNFVCLFGQSWFSIDGILLHIIVYPFIRMGFSWCYLIIIVVSLMCMLLAWRGKTYCYMYLYGTKYITI